MRSGVLAFDVILVFFNRTLDVFSLLTSFQRFLSWRSGTQRLICLHTSSPTFSLALPNGLGKEATQLPISHVPISSNLSRIPSTHNVDNAMLRLLIRASLALFFTITFTPSYQAATALLPKKAPHRN